MRERTAAQYRADAEFFRARHMENAALALEERAAELEEREDEGN